MPGISKGTDSTLRFCVILQAVHTSCTPTDPTLIPENKISEWLAPHSDIHIVPAFTVLPVHG